MATSEEYLSFVCEQIARFGAVRYRKMFGDATVYLDDKPILLVCDNTVFVKCLPETAALLGHALHILPGSQRSDAHGQLLNDLERLPPDGAGRTEDRQIFCHHITSPQTG